MIYLDNAATGYPKPRAVYEAMRQSVVCHGANPGRGGYPMAVAATEALYTCRETAAQLFGLSDSRRVVFTLNCTAALNIAINSVLQKGGRVVVSDLEHNAVMRPLHARGGCYPCYDTAEVTVGDDEATVEAFRRAITPQTKAIVCTHASNVIGCVLPIKQLAALAHAHGLVLIVDAAQSAGHIPIHMENDGIDYLCAAGHKGLYGPMGTGILLCREDVPLVPLVYGGTGSASLSLTQPEELPDRLESGTPNVVGIDGLQAGMRWVLQTGVERVAAHELALCRALYEALEGTAGVRLYSPWPQDGRATAVLSLTVDGLSVEQTAQALACHGIAVRAGLHCAPAAHRAIGTLPDGTVRLSMGAFNTLPQMQNCAQILKKIAANPLLFAV